MLQENSTVCHNISLFPSNKFNVVVFFASPGRVTVEQTGFRNRRVYVKKSIFALLYLALKKLLHLALKSCYILR